MVPTSKKTPPEPYFSGYSLFLFQVFITLRLQTGQPEKMSHAELISIVKDIHHLADALHNIPMFLAGLDDSFTPKDIEELFIKDYDQTVSVSGKKMFRLSSLLTRCIEEARSKQNG
jgi:hypothetical protein